MFFAQCLKETVSLYLHKKKKTFNILRLLVNQSEHELGLKKDFWLLSLLPISNQTFTAKGKIH